MYTTDVYLFMKVFKPIFESEFSHYFAEDSKDRAGPTPSGLLSEIALVISGIMTWFRYLLQRRTVRDIQRETKAIEVRIVAEKCVSRVCVLAAAL